MGSKDCEALHQAQIRNAVVASGCLLGTVETVGVPVVSTSSGLSLSAGLIRPQEVLILLSTGGTPFKV